MFPSNSYVEMNYIKMLYKCLRSWPSEDLNYIIYYGLLELSIEAQKA